MSDDIKFSELPVDASKPQPTDIVAVVTSGVSKQQTMETIGLAGLSEGDILIGSAGGNLSQASSFSYDANTGRMIINNYELYLNSSIETIGNYSVILNFSGDTNINFPTSGTLVNSAVSTLSNLSSIGTISTGVWQASPIGSAYGGTGFSSYTIGDILYADTATTLAKLSDIATGNALISGGIATAPSWGKIGLTTHVSGILPSSNGGTGVNNGTSTLTLAGNLSTVGAFPAAFTFTGSTAVTFPTSGTLATTGASIASITGTANQVLVNGTSGSPITGAVTLTTPQNIATTSSPTFAGLTLTSFSGVVKATAGVLSATSILDVASGGTGQSTYTNGQLLIGNTATGSLSKATLTAGTGITITNGNGTITIASSGGAGDVTGIIGTANQVLANGTSGSSVDGEVTLTLPQSIGTSSSVQFGSLGVGASPFSAAQGVIAGTVTGLSGGFNYGLALNVTHSPSSAADYAVELLVNPNITSNSNITNVIGGYFKSGVGGGGGGVFANGYSIYAEAPITGTNKTAIYTDNISVGYTGITPGTNSACISGSVSVGASSAGGKLDVQGSQSAAGAVYGTLLRTNVTETGSASGTCGLFLGGTHTINGSGTNTVSYMQITPTITATTSTSNYYGLIVNAGSATGTVTSSYSLYATAPGFGTNRTAIYTDNLSIGYTGITPPSSGAVISGKLGVGTSSPASTTAAFEVATTASSSSTYNGTLLTPTLTQTGNGQSVQVLQVTGTVVVNGTGTNSGEFLRINPLFTATTTINNAFGAHIFGPSGTGTTNNAYSLFVEAPTIGSNKAAIYTDNLSVGYTGTTPPSSGAIISGKFGVGVSSVDSNSKAEIQSTGAYGLRISGTQTSTVNEQIGSIWIRSALQPTSGTTGVVAHIFNQAFVIAPAAQTISHAAACFLAQDYEFNAGTITNAYQLLISTTAAGAGTITNSYGAYVTNPTAGTNKCALYTDNLSIGYTGTAPNSSGASISGPVSIGSSSASSSAILELTSTSKGLRLPQVTLPGTGVSSPVESLIVYESLYKAPFFYDGSAWSGIGGLSLISALSFTNNAAIGYTTTSNSPLTNFNTLMIVFENLLPVTDSVTFQFQVSTNNGSSFLSSGYAGGATSNATASSNTWSNVNTTSYVTCGALRNTSPASGYIMLTNRNMTAPQFMGRFSQLGSTAIVNSYQTNSNINAFQISFSSGNISTVRILIYGMLQS
jgi:hypothetical protein